MDKEDFKFMKPGEVRVRIAPSPTGFMHVGLARTALFNYLFAKKHNGVFVLRIEDTDAERSDPKFEKDITETLKWLGVEWDEGPDIGGPYGPYRQSERGEIYKKYLENLIKEGKAYYCFCSEEELESQRQYFLSIGQPPIYNGKCRNLDEKTVKKYLKEGKKAIIRFKTPTKKIKFNDLVKGEIEFDTSLIGDFSIAKDLTSPLYNFAVVIDDFEMKISHVLRGEEHISNTPKQILLQEALGFPSPQYGHLPLILGPDRSKLSKRHGAVAVSEYKRQGYLPEAIINFIAFLGWNPGTEREIYSLPTLIKDFSIGRIQKSGAVFNIKRLDFLNGFYIRQKPTDKLTQLCLPYLIEKKLIERVSETSEKFKIIETREIVDINYLEKIVKIYQERLKKLSELPELTDFFFKEKLEFDKNLLKWRNMTDKEVKQALDKLEKVLSKIKENLWNREYLEKVLLEEAENFVREIGRVGELASGKTEPVKRIDRGYFLWPLRVALSGKEASAGPFEIAEILGKEKTLKRIKEAKKKL